MTDNLLGEHTPGHVTIGGYRYPARRYPNGEVRYQRSDGKWADARLRVTTGTFKADEVRA